MKQKIFLCIFIVLLFIGGWSMLANFLPNHQYYANMFSASSNRRLFIWGLISTLIPLGYVVYTKNITLKKSLIMTTLGLLLYSIAFVSIKDDLVNAAGFVILILNVLIIFGLGIYSIVSRTAIGSWIIEKVVKISIGRWQDMLLAFGLGLGAMMVVINFLVIFHIFYPIIARLLFVCGGIAIRKQRQGALRQYTAIIEDMLSSIQIKNIILNKWLRVGVVLLGLSIVYFYYGFQLSFIPYSTAWDANHAYMYIPKVRAENHGALGWGQPGGAGGFLWQSYIAFFFSLTQPIKSRFRLSPDNIAVSMNFLSGVFVLIFGIGLVKELTGYITSVIIKTKDDIIEWIGLYAGWIGLLLWITSGMGAFLVFVDNKTDMGVLAMTVLAILSGVIFIRYIHEHKKEHNNPTILKYVVLGGIFFGLAVGAKPTAFIDVVVFTLVLVGLWINIGMSLGIGFVVLALLAKMQVLFTYEFLSAQAFIPLLIIGVVLTVISLIYAMRTTNGLKQTLSHAVRTLIVRGVVIIGVVFILRGPYLVIQSIESGDSTIKGFFHGLLMGSNINDTPKTLLAATYDNTMIQEQNAIDNKVSLPSALCSLDTLGITQDALDDNIRDFSGGNGLSEDVGRYVGFGRKEFSHGLGYEIAKRVFPQTGKCYGWNSTAKVLCTNEEAINNFDLQTLQDIVQQISPESEGYRLLQDALTSQKLQSMLANNNFNPAEMKDEIVAIRQWYQGRSIKAKDNSLMVPYRYIVPWNAVFNRSLQNLSSYYTDIGFIRGIIILLQIVGCIYALSIRNQKLLAFSTVSLVGWVMRWMIAGGIVWYGIGLIIRSVITIVILLITLYARNRDKNDRILFAIVIILFLLWSTIQLLMNFMRISSQGGGGPFIRYKMGAGNQQIIENTLGQNTKLKIPYTRKDVFDLQFSHYNKFIEYVKDRPDEDGVSIAGTYLQYFLHNQHNVGGANIYKTTSDGNTCKSYLRFQRDGWKYLVIDPNILSVVMGEGNESLMYRFFAKRNPVTGKIDEDGEMTMLVRMRYDGYVSLFSTNNLGAKYAFLLSDEELSAAFGLTTKDDLVFMRAKMGVARFFPDAQQIINFVGNTFVQRIGNGQAIGDVADVFGKIIDESKLLSVAQQITANANNAAKNTQLVDALTQDERFVLAQYLGLYNLLRQNSPQFQQVLNQILGQSVTGSSQVIIFELK